MGNGCSKPKIREKTPVPKAFLNNKHREKTIPKQELQTRVNNTQSLAKYAVNKMVVDKAIIFSLVLISANRIASGGRDNTIKIWDVDTLRNEVTLVGHTSSVTYLTMFNDENLLSGSDGEVIKTWDIVRNVCIRTFNGGDVFYITSIVKINENYLWSSSNSKDIKLWDVKSGKALRSLTGHTFAVYSLLKLKHTPYTVLSASADCSVRIWDDKILESNNERTLVHDDRVHVLLEFSEGVIICGCDDSSLWVWNIQGHNLRSKMKGHQEAVICLVKLNDNTLASGGKDRRIIIWSIDENVIVASLNFHLDCVRNLVKISDTKLASAGYDQSICLWNL